MREEGLVTGGGGPPRSRFTVEVRSVPGADTDVVRVGGELDHDTVAPLRDAMAERVGAGRIVVDCSALDFCDSSGLNALLKARLRATEAGRRLELAGLRPPVDRLFEITGAQAVFRVYATLGEALAESGRESGGGDGRDD
ncbi:STAS domain-containing protein [Streptomyces showdoensis]|uniref:Anti-sigma factor antagonist n=1 Tax=Streptomyces showdoensis TaxID=68268 RepID=A0A2P2GUS4_STREW|nr:STAS domain-containing protein [Streptomyces showdoensis]KKZ75238.1 hypothetical protein VO63_03730 [Streptomyces showdoensis]